MYFRFHNLQLLISVCQCGKAISAYYKLLKVSCLTLYIFTTSGFCTLDCIDRDIDGFKWYFHCQPRILVCVLVLVFCFFIFIFFSCYLLYCHVTWFLNHTAAAFYTYIYMCVYIYKITLAPVFASFLLNHHLVEGPVFKYMCYIKKKKKKKKS